MTASPNDRIVSEFKKFCDGLIDSARESKPGTSAYEMEVSIYRQLLEIGALALEAYFESQASHYHHATATNAEGRTLGYCGERNGLFYSIFGNIRMKRSYYSDEGRGFFAMDAGLNLPPSGQSDFARMLVEELSIDMSYEKATTYLAKILRVQPSTRAVQTAIQTDSQDAEAFYEQAPAPAPCAEATILVVEADNKGVPMVNLPIERAAAEPTPGKPKGERKREGKTKEATVVSVSTHVPYNRTPEQVRDSLFRDRTSKDKVHCDPREKPTFKRTWATMKGKAEGLAQADVWARQVMSPYIAFCIALTDGQGSLQRRVDERFPDYVRILDLIHAIQYLWKAADAQFGKGNKTGWLWVYDAVLRMLQGQTSQIIAELDEWANRTKDEARWGPIETSAGYFEKNLQAMKYDEYLAKGWPIATGIIEGACRHVIKDRCEQSGMRWTEQGVEAFLHLRCIHQNGDWDAYHTFRIKQRHERVYGIKSTASHGFLDTDAYRFSTGQTYADAV